MWFSIQRRRTTITEKKAPEQRYRLGIYGAVFIALLVGQFTLRESIWTGSAELHTLMECTATLIAMVVGLLALVRYYSRKDGTFLFAGCGFLGTALLDGYHAIVTSNWFANDFPSALPSLIPWSWSASRLFLAVLLWMSWLAWSHEKRNNGRPLFGERTVYLSVAVLTVASFVFFAFIPLPQGYFSQLYFPRSEEFAAALFFLMALIGYLHKGHWRHSHFEHWLILALIVSFMSQALFMSLSGRFFDMMFDVAHLLKIASYLCVLTGLSISMYMLLHRIERDTAALSRANKMLKREIHERERVASERNGFFSLQLDMLCIAGFDGYLKEINPAWERTLGFSMQELLARPFIEFVHEEDRETTLIEARKLTEGRNTVEFENRCRCANGSFRWLLWSATADRDRQLIYAAARDITERHGRIEAHKESESQLRAVLENIVDGIVTIDQHGLIESCNPATERIFGYNSKEMIGQNVKMLMASPNRERHDHYLKRYLETGEARIIGIGREVEGRRKDGSHFPVDLAVSELSSGGRRHFVGILRDISERKKIERMKTEFVSTVSHELRTPLTSIRGSLGLITGGAAGEVSDKIKSLLSIALNNSERLVRLINDILDIEKIEAGKMLVELRSHELRPLVEQAVKSNQVYALEHGAEIEIVPSSFNPRVIADGDRLIQVITNFLSNAAKFSPKGGIIRVEIRRLDDSVRIAVTDQGPGIAEDFRDRVFDRFAMADASDSRQKGGTGLGLNICRDIAERLGARVGFDTESGKGTTFYIDLPVLESDPSIDTPISSDPKNRRLILHVEDDADLRRVVASMLQDIAQIVEVDSVHAARTQLRQRDFDLLILDMKLPDGSGLDLLQEINIREPPILVVLFSAAEVEQDITDAVAASLVKSKTNEETLLKTVHYLLSKFTN